MPISTLSDAACPATEGLAEETESVSALKPSCPPVVLSAEAKERLKVLNRALANCVPKSLGDRDPMSFEAT